MLHRLGLSGILPTRRLLKSLQEWLCHLQLSGTVAHSIILHNQVSGKNPFPNRGLGQQQVTVPLQTFQQPPKLKFRLMSSAQSHPIVKFITSGSIQW